MIDGVHNISYTGGLIARRLDVVRDEVCNVYNPPNWREIFLLFAKRQQLLEEEHSSRPMTFLLRPLWL